MEFSHFPHLRRASRGEKKLVDLVLRRTAVPAQEDEGRIPEPSPATLRMEGEDAHMTGMTRSLSRRVMALNFPMSGSVMKRPKVA